MDKITINNRIWVILILGGKRFELGRAKSGWGRLGRISYAKRPLPVDNVHIFEKTWTYEETHTNAQSLDDVVGSVLDKVWTCRTEIQAFARVNDLRLLLDSYVEYERGARPLTELGLKNIKRMAKFGCSIGLEVVELPRRPQK